jgi:hypothetical protein
VAEEEADLVKDLGSLRAEFRDHECAALDRLAVIAVNKSGEVLCRISAENLQKQIVGSLSFLAGKSSPASSISMSSSPLRELT